WPRRRREIAPGELLDRPVKFKIIVGRGILRRHGGKAQRRRQLGGLGAVPVYHLLEHLRPSGLTGPGVEGACLVGHHEADHHPPGELGRGRAAIARVRNEIARHDRDRIAAQALVAPERAVVDEPDLPHRALWYPLLELRTVGRQDRVIADERIEGPWRRY